MLFSRTVRPGKTRRPSGTCATPRLTIARGLSRPIVLPSNRIEPARGATSPEIARSGRRLACSVGAEQGDDGALFDRERDAPHGLDLAETDPQVSDLEECHHETPR